MNSKHNRSTGCGEFDVIVIGSGPAGLAAGCALLTSGYTFAVFESGSKPGERARDISSSLVKGVGGAGLYSDGKFSFFPSATALWRLDDKGALRESYQWLVKRLDNYGLDEIPLSESWLNGFDVKTTEIIEKHYPSLRLSLTAREAMIADLYQQLGSNIYSNSRVLSIREGETGFKVYIESRGETCVATAKIVIFAGGRFGATGLKQMMPELPTVFRRFEVGIRVEQPAERFLYKDNPSTDVKIVERGQAEQWRTFCTCRNGEVIETDWDGIRTFSGRGDGPATGNSNIGLNLRFTQPPKDEELLDEIFNVIHGNVTPFSASLKEFKVLTKIFFGPKLDERFRTKLDALIEHDASGDTKIYGPCIEGVGSYHDICQRR